MRVLESACDTNPAAVAGSFAALTALKAPKKGLVAAVSLAYIFAVATSATAITKLNIFRVFMVKFIYSDPLRMPVYALQPSKSTKKFKKMRANRHRFGWKSESSFAPQQCGGESRPTWAANTSKLPCVWT